MRLPKRTCLVFLAVTARVYGASGTEGAAFLDIPTGAGPAAMGSAYAALANDAYAPVYNPAGLGFLPATQAAAQHLAYLDSIHYEFLSFVHPVAAGKALGASAQYLGSGDMAGTDPSGASLGDYSSRYGAYTLSYGQQVTKKLSLGLSAKWINAELDDTSANAYAADVGGLYQAGSKLQFAAKIANAGSQLKFADQGDSLPLAFHAAAACQPRRRWNLALEALYGNAGLAGVRWGSEWKPLEMLAIRAGYRTETLDNLSALAGVSAGLGLNVWGQELAYAWLPYGDLGDTHYVSLVMRLGHGPDAQKNLIQYQNIRTHSAADKDGPRPGGEIAPEEQQWMELLNGGERDAFGRINRPESR